MSDLIEITFYCIIALIAGLCLAQFINDKYRK